MSYVIASSSDWRPRLLENLSKRTGMKFSMINKKEELTLQNLKAISPQAIFFPHWSYIISPDIFENFECVIFHMTDVPFGRGGSPLQNLISREIYETKISALRCVKELDAGPVYLKRQLSLHGAAEEIYLRASEIIEDMICQIIKEKPVPVAQTGEITCFSRRKPAQSNLAELTSLKEVFDYIRMLGANGYPRAFLETEHFRFEFERASLRKGEVIADVKITEKENE